MVNMNTCYFCHNNDTKYCSICQKWLCDNCRKNYPKRIVGVLSSFKERWGL